MRAENYIFNIFPFFIMFSKPLLIWTFYETLQMFRAQLHPSPDNSLMLYQPLQWHQSQHITAVFTILAQGALKLAPCTFQAPPPAPQWEMTGHSQLSRVLTPRHQLLCHLECLFPPYSLWAILTSLVIHSPALTFPKSPSLIPPS